MTDKILIDRAVVEQALEALLTAHQRGNATQWANEGLAINALRAALEQSQVEQEPVAAQCRFEGEAEWRHCTVAHHLHVQAHPKEWPHYETRALYTHPQPPRQPLTEMEIVDLRQLTPGTLDVQFVKFARVIEAAHGIKEQK